MSVSPESLQATSQSGGDNSTSFYPIGQQANQSGLLQVSGDRILPNNVSHNMDECLQAMRPTYFDSPRLDFFLSSPLSVPCRATMSVPGDYELPIDHLRPWVLYGM